ncbi:MAG: Poly-beta-hydroxybutyrate polymerase domain protein [Frankiales bacterium]|nr:Poly-beta-hydroxybutyrate polymerase domain protein [Frankiales bacterium]
MTTPRTQNADVSAPLDMLLTQGSLGMRSRAVPFRSTIAFGTALAKRPRRVAARAGTLTAELGRIAVGGSKVAPSSRDKRFADPAWSENPALRRIVQTYLAAAACAEGLAQDVPMEWQDAERVRFAVSGIVEALAPSNNPLTSPLAWKAAIDTGGLSIARGLRNAVSDLATAPRIPKMVDTSSFTLGENLGASEGAVVLRTPVFELIQYTPKTETVRTEPLLVVPPSINKYYVLDLSPDRSMIRHLVESGQQVFVMSWRNPDARHSKWGVDVYVQSILDAMAAVRTITDTTSTHLMAACSGGILASMTSSYLEQTGRIDELASLTLLVTVLDQSRGGTTSAFVDESVAAAAVAASRRKGYLDGKQLAEIFAWLRPNDLVWNYVVSNWLQGKQPPAFDILAWNADTTRMAARLHADFLSIAMSNGLTRPGGTTVLGNEVDLQKVTVDSYVVAGVADHLCRWQNCYQSTQMLGGSSRFILSTNGHIAALVNPPGNPKSSYLAQDDAVKPSTSAEEWQAGAEQKQGSWWPDYVAWLTERSGEQKGAPAELGSEVHKVLEAAPGSYVLDA